jgi:spore cortex biosynthesis protein YabQ
LPDLYAQIASFGLTILLGILTGLLFHLYQAFIRAGALKRLLVYVLDLAMWLITLVFVFFALLYINLGEVRVYVLLALLIGGILYYRLLHKRLETPFYRLARLVFKFLQSVAGILKKPFRILFIYLKTINNRFKKNPPPADD